MSTFPLFPALLGVALICGVSAQTPPPDGHPGQPQGGPGGMPGGMGPGGPGRPGGPGGMMPPGMNTDDMLSLGSLGLIDEGQRAQLKADLKAKIQKHNASILKTYDVNHDGKLSASEKAAMKKAQAQHGPGGMPPGMGGGPSNGPSAQPTGEVTVTAKDSKAPVSGKTYKADKSGESVILANAATASADRLTLQKTGNAASEEESNFYGNNAGVLAIKGAKLTLTHTTITTDGSGANAAFAYGKGSAITLTQVSIATTRDSSRGLDATFGGSVTGTDLTIKTRGAHCACLATDRGEGTITVTRCKGESRGDGSPGIYSTGNISATDSQFVSYGSEGAVIEGKNSITLKNTTLDARRKWGVMLYQSFSGDARVGTSVFTMTGGSITAAEGPMFFITNTHAKAHLDGVKLSATSGTLINLSAARWGNSGSNGGHLELTATNQELKGNIELDGISSLALTLGDKSTYTGAINTKRSGGQVTLTLNGDATVTLTGDSYVSVVTFSGSDAASAAKSAIISRGHHLYYDASNAKNAALKSSTIALPDGGTLEPAKEAE